jgi:hypothetical protein
MFASIGEIVTHPSPRERTPVRRHSRERGYCEGVFWRPTTRQELRMIVLAARRYELAGRQPGGRNGPLGHVALEVIELLANLVSYRNGRLDPSLDYLMTKLRRSRDAVVRALRALRDHGFLDWLRRYVPTGKEGRGPQVQQTSNAYRLSLPERAKRLLGRLAQPAPPPDDHSHAQETRAAEIEAHRASLPLVERILFDGGADDPITQALARMALLRQQRESARQTESPC